jgi:hypothetical protein
LATRRIDKDRPTSIHCPHVSEPRCSIEFTVDLNDQTRVRFSLIVGVPKMLVRTSRAHLLCSTSPAYAPGPTTVQQLAGCGANVIKIDTLKQMEDAAGEQPGGPPRAQPLRTDREEISHD